MPPRDQHDYEQRRQQIIDGALRVFASKGFDKATNKDIADAAGIGSAGLIYHYFESKDDLLRQVIECHAPLVPLASQVDAFMDLPPPEALALFGRTLLRVIGDRELVAFFKVVLGEATRRPALLETISQVGPGLWIPVIRRYLEQQMDAGVLRRTDPAAAARCFVGPLLVYVLTREVLAQPDAQALDPEMMIQTAVEIFMRGMQVEDASAAVPGGP